MSSHSFPTRRSSDLLDRLHAVLRDDLVRTLAVLARAAILRQLERWYDADVVYKDIINIHLNATIDRSVPVSKVLQLLEATGQVHFEIEGKQIKVSKL